LYIFIND